MTNDVKLFMKQFEKAVRSLSDTTIHSMTEIDLDDFEWLDYGSARMVWRKGKYVYKVAMNAVGIPQNMVEAEVSEDNIDEIAQVEGIYSLMGVDNMLIVQEYHQLVSPYLAEIIECKANELGYSRITYDITFEAIDELLKEVPKNEAGEVISDILKEIKDFTIIERSEGFGDDPLNSRVLDRSTAGSFPYSYLANFTHYNQELCRENVGVRLDDKGNLKSLVIIDNGYSEDIQDFYLGLEPKYDFIINEDGVLILDK